MTTAEKITMGISLLTALGVGALLPALVGHLLGRGEKRVNIAEKSVQIAEALMSRMETELARAQEALAKAQQESEELRADLVRSGEKLAQSEAEKSRVKATVEEQMELTRGELDRASNVIGNIQYNVYQVKEINRLSHTAGIDKWGAAVEALVKSGFDIMTRPVDDPDDDGGAVPAQPNRR